MFRAIQTNEKRSKALPCSAAKTEESSSVPVEVRLKLMKNREELDNLLLNVPNLLKQHRERNQSKITDMKNPVVSLPSKYLHQRCSDKRHNDASSSDEELKDPVDDSSPRLSEEEHGSERANSPISCDREPRDNANAHQTSTATIENKTTLGETSVGLLLRNRPSKALYEVAKPKPPPRLRKLKRDRLSQCNFDAQSSGCALEEAKNPSVEDESQISRVEAGIGESRDTVQLTSDVTQSDFEKTQIEEDSSTECANYLTISHAPRSFENNAPSSRSAFCFIPSKSDSFSNTRSSGYFSQKSGSASLSSSSSNASSTNSAKLALSPTSDHFKKYTTAAKRRSFLLENIKNFSFHDNDRPVDGLELNPVEEDNIFPVKSWIESSEYASIAQKNADEESLSVALSENSSDSAIRKRNQTPAVAQKMVPKQRLDSSGQGNSAELQIVNSISMVERSSQSDADSRAGFLSSVKLRMPGNRLKKRDDSRSSRAFALQLKQLNEDSAFSSYSEKSGRDNSDLSPANDVSIVNKTDDVFKTPLPPKSIHSAELTGEKKSLSQSLASLNRETSSDKVFHTVSGATGRHLSEKSTFFHDEVGSQSPSSNRSSTRFQSSLDGSTWSLNHQHSTRRSSLKNRLKGAFSFQNIRKAISMERLNESHKHKSFSHSYLNEFGEDISQLPRQRSVTTDSTHSDRLNKAPSVTSIFSTVRMRKRKSRERRAAKARNTIAVDPRHVPSFGNQREQTHPAIIEDTSVGSPGHFRPIGRVLEMNVREGSYLIEMVKPRSGPFDFYIARRKETGNVYISSLSDSYPEKMYAGLMKLGDEITEINRTSVDRLTLDQIYDIISECKTLVLRIKPSQIHIV